MDHVRSIAQITVTLNLLHTQRLRVSGA